MTDGEKSGKIVLPLCEGFFVVHFVRQKDKQRQVPKKDSLPASTEGGTLRRKTKINFNMEVPNHG